MDIALFVLHVIPGLLLMGHGAQKLFGWVGGQGLDGAGAFMETIGLYPGKLHAFISGLAEFAGGALIVLGLFVPFAAAAIIGVMVVASLTVHLANGIWAQNGGYELPLTNIAIVFALAGAGAGELSLDHALGLDLAGAGWALGALGAGLLGGLGAYGFAKAQSPRASANTA